MKTKQKTEGGLQNVGQTRRSFLRTTAALAAGALIAPATRVFAADGKTYKIAISIYAGWMPYYYGDKFGIFEKHLKAQGLNVKFIPMDYGPSIEAYSTGQVDGVVITNMDVLMQPATTGVDSTVVVVGDYSNGNDALLVREKKFPTIQSLKGNSVHLVTGTVSEYVLARALETAKLALSDVNVSQLGDGEIQAAFTEKKIDATVTWAPITLGIEQQPGVKRLFDSSKIPGEVLDLLVLNTKTVKSEPKLASGLAAGWYETIGLMNKRGDASNKVLTEMAGLARCSLGEYQAQLKTTAMFWNRKDAVEYTKGPEIKPNMERVAKFLFDKGFLGKDAKSPGHFGIQFPDGSVLGDKGNVKLRFTTEFMEA